MKKISFGILTLMAALASGCHSPKGKSCCGILDPMPEASAAAPASLAAPVSEPVSAPVAATATTPSDSVPGAPLTAPIRIKAGASAPFTDSNSNVWLADQGFQGGETVERPEMEIANTTEPGLYRSEHYSMSSFSWPLPNGSYVVKLHFAETFEDITGPGQRVFSFKVQGREFKDFDLFAKAGGARRAYVETVETQVTNGRLQIDFISNIENPEINAIEILP